MSGIALPSYAAGFAGRGLNDIPWAWDGLVGAWEPSLGASGKILHDISGNGNHGTLMGDAHSVAGKHGTALIFNATDYVSPPLPFTPWNGQTFSVVFNFSTNSVATLQWVISLTVSGSNEILRAAIVGSAITFVGGSSATNVNITGSTIASNVWYHCVYTFNFNQSLACLYLDGVLDGSDQAVTDPGSTLGGVRFGGPFWSVSDGLKGQIDHVLIYDRALLPIQAKELYERRKQLVNV